jgi:predicted ribosome quality control (RQC) complex YloA/Tae2 family protein
MENNNKNIKELSALDIHYLLTEFNILINSKIENIYQKENIIYINLHIPNLGKKILKIILPNFIYMTEHKEEMLEKPPQFCTILRKHLRNGRIRDITQIDFERIVCIKITTKEKEFNLIVELFSKGNLILCNNEMKIIYPMTHQKWKDRIIKGGQLYKHPKKTINIKETIKTNQNEFEKIINNTTMDSIVTFLAKEIGLGGKYAEIICKETKTDKKEKPIKVNNEIIFNYIKELFNKKNCINNILDLLLTEKTVKEQKEKHNKKYKDNKSKVNKILDTQINVIEKQEKIIKESSLKGDKIYENYKEIQEIITELNEIRKKHSWSDIKKKLNNHDKIKNIEEKVGKITIKLN